jgi:hypothetical protein
MAGIDIACPSNAGPVPGFSEAWNSGRNQKDHSGHGHDVWLMSRHRGREPTSRGKRGEGANRPERMGLSMIGSRTQAERSVVVVDVDVVVAVAGVITIGHSFRLQSRD